VILIVPIVCGWPYGGDLRWGTSRSTDWRTALQAITASHERDDGENDLRGRGLASWGYYPVTARGMVAAFGSAFFTPPVASFR
jgi:hypothetical protein